MPRRAPTRPHICRLQSQQKGDDMGMELKRRKPYMLTVPDVLAHALQHKQRQGLHTSTASVSLSYPGFRFGTSAPPPSPRHPPPPGKNLLFPSDRYLTSCKGGDDR